MKKKLSLVAAILLFAVSSAWADTLDVCLPWTHAQRHVPINTAYADWGFENEFIYPASRVNEMAGGTITQITFYAMSDSLDFPETFQLRMEEVADTATQPLAYGQVRSPSATVYGLSPSTPLFPTWAATCCSHSADWGRMEDS